MTSNVAVPPGPTIPPSSADDWRWAIARAISAPDGQPLAVAKQALQHFPNEGWILHLAGLAALVEQKPKEYLPINKRMMRYYDSTPADHLLMAVFHAQSGHWSSASAILEKNGLTKAVALNTATRYWKGCDQGAWIRSWYDAIRKEEKAQASARSAKAKSATQPDTKASTAKAKVTSASSAARSASATTAPKQQTRSADTPSTQPQPAPASSHTAVSPPDPLLAEFPELPKLEVRVAVRFDLPDLAVPVFDRSSDGTDRTWFDLRQEFTHLGLLQGFSELLCLSHLQNVDTYWYQVETVRKVLKQFRGRVLLADEVGLGKTIEAGMILKEYLLRGMASRILILTPASLVGQWQEEMDVKFGISCITTQDPLFRADPDTFWQEPRIIASLAVARREEQCRILEKQRFDLVIVDEAHHLRNRITRNWKLVDGLNKRFLILLTATPVQNSLVELYNLLTLLKPGIFPTEKEFRAQHVSSRNPRTPLNPERLRELMRDVMIRNTRALVDVRLPPRHAVTMRVPGEANELSCYHSMFKFFDA